MDWTVPGFMPHSIMGDYAEASVTVPHTIVTKKLDVLTVSFEFVLWLNHSILKL